MAIGKLLPRRASPLRVSVSARPDIRCRKAWPPGRKARYRRSSEKFRGLVTPPLPFAEAERKASPNGLSIIRFPAKCLRLKSDFSQDALIGAQGFPGLRGLPGYKTCLQDLPAYGFGVSSLNR